jgi:hypothetical protein
VSGECWNCGAAELEQELDREREQYRAAVEAIRKAPHAQHCEAGSPMWPGPCNCWKRDWQAL